MTTSAAGPEISDALRDFWRERHLCTLTTLRPDASPHVVPVGVTFDPDGGVARVITSARSRKAAHVRAAGVTGARVAVCQVDGKRWSTLEGLARLHDDPPTVRDAEQRYALRYRVPRPNPDRVVLVITVTRRLGNV
ncbi:PPOX class F420-dependent oxidoreductase [Solwaraspora sp. WMMD792]|uniref:pyridoxamine 5'-phosphate oxidase family protein n=1 Tax=Solwaraspora sp. WMMD792 TaxID=3016099 RepID=UPI002416D3D1|nr:PPOX class F420-dependent oxidoreductase [Solwaraspora sp. WMMD792]MDG4770802.1 PPOX class F420-dependent oxidoreductase [Solwaraspora sp. WMMD792]